MRFAPLFQDGSFVTSLLVNTIGKSGPSLLFCFVWESGKTPLAHRRQRLASTNALVSCFLVFPRVLKSSLPRAQWKALFFGGVIVVERPSALCDVILSHRSWRYIHTPGLEIALGWSRLRLSAAGVSSAEGSTCRSLLPRCSSSTVICAGITADLV